jgi:hypothetical protein
MIHATVSWGFCSGAYDGFAADVGDYKSPYGIVGTGFWRASEVLKALHEKITPTLQKLWMCMVLGCCVMSYSLVTLFEELGLSEYELVLSGR